MQDDVRSTWISKLPVHISFRRRSWYDFVVQDTKFRNCLPQKNLQIDERWACEPQHSVRLPPPFLTEADLVMFNAVVSACAGAMQWRRALEVLFRYMHLEAQWLATYHGRFGEPNGIFFFLGEATRKGRKIAGFGIIRICPDGWMLVNGSDMTH